MIKIVDFALAPKNSMPTACQASYDSYDSVKQAPLAPSMFFDDFLLIIARTTFNRLNNMNMLFNIRSWSIGAKLSSGIFALVGTVFFTFILVLGYFSSQLAERDAVREVSDQTKSLSRTVEIVDKDLHTQVSTFAKVFRSRFEENFSVDASRTIDVEGKATPVLTNGASDVNLNFSIPDSFTALTGVYATVFVRSGDEFIRITTSHKKENGARAIGTAMDHAHPAYQLMLEDKTYSGTATLFGGQYMTQYNPIKNAEGKIIGALYVGVSFTDSMKSFADGVKAMKLGESGFFYALSAKPGIDYGKLLIHPSAEGQNLLESKDANGREFIKEILEQKNGSFHYLEIAKDNTAPRERIASFSYNKNWNMVVVGDVYLDEITAAATRQRNQFAAVGLLMAILISAAIYPIIRVMVSKPIGEALKIAKTVASGDLSSHIEVHSADEAGQLLQALKDMNDSLIGIVSEVRGGTDTIVAASSQIASGNQELSSRTEQQASSLEETASSMEELTSTVKQNADNARQANSLAISASNVASQGGLVVAQVVDTMNAINDSAKKIVDIISVIDSIAFQTNILALNAAVEAARAGEQGRGFAVVASEVRNLAQRSAGAAREIKALIGNSVEKVQEGSKLVDQAGTTMSEVVDSVKRVTDIISEIAAASQEQSAGIDQINIAITEMDNVTQQNAAMVEEAAAAAAALEDQAGRLAQVVSIFRTNGVQGQNTLSAPATRHTATVSKAAAKPRFSTVQNLKRVAPVKQFKQVAGGPVNDDWEEF